MIFAALTSALVVRKGGSTDWKGFTLPSILYLNTLVFWQAALCWKLVGVRLEGS